MFGVKLKNAAETLSVWLEARMSAKPSLESWTRNLVPAGSAPAPHAAVSDVGDAAASAPASGWAAKVIVEPNGAKTPPVVLTCAE